MTDEDFVDESVIAFAEDLLDRARRGQVTALACSTIGPKDGCDEGAVSHHVVGCARVLTLIGSVAVLYSTVISAMSPQNRVVQWLGDSKPARADS
jgi:hypothetical protein